MSNHLHKFEILDLHDNRDLIVNFGSRATILTGENGTGKTTALAALYAILSGKYYKLRSLIFDRIILHSQDAQLELSSEDAQGPSIIGTPGTEFYLAEERRLSLFKRRLCRYERDAARWPFAGAALFRN